MAEHTPDSEHPMETPSPQDAEPTGAEDQSAETDAQKPRSRGSAESLAEGALEDVEAAAQRIDDEASRIDLPHPMDLPELNHGSQSNGGTEQGMGLLADVSLNVTIELGRTRMYVEDVLRLNENSIVELDKAAGDPVDIYVNGCHVARGEVLVLNENFCVRVSEIIATPTEGGDAPSP